MLAHAGIAYNDIALAFAFLLGLYALDAASGQVKWKFKTGKPIHSDAAVSDGEIYVGSDDHYFYTVHAATGRLKWKFKLGGDVDSFPVVSDGVVYVGSADHFVYAIR